MRIDNIMKVHLLETLKELENQGLKIEETPPLFRWSYEETPGLLFELLITKPDIEDAFEVDIVEKQNAPTTDTQQ